MEWLLKKALDFIEKLIAGPFMEGTGIFTDKVKYWRFKNQVNIITKAKEYLKSKGIETPKKISIKDVTTLLEHASFEEDEIMQDSWAKLLANTMNPNNQFDTSNIFIQILNQLSVNEVYILHFIYSNSFLMSSGDRPYFERAELERNGRTQLATRGLLIDNLLRLRLIEEQPPKLHEEIKKRSDEYIEEEDIYSVIVASDKFRFSLFGVELARQIFE
ncbi:Abi-alpha family protein [Flagellimonas meridianipacifica]|nr:Abi-alpha family protein [Allomuricauda pacifica]